MAAKEDILEQLVEEYLIHRGYFVRHNIKFKPRKDHPDFIANEDSNHSDIDVIGYHPKLTGPEKIWVVSCKSWQAGFNPTQKITEIHDGKIANGREAWKGFRELVKHKWSEAFIEAIYSATNSREFTYVTAVTELKGDRTIWEEEISFREAIAGNPIKLITLREMLQAVFSELGTTMAGTELGRTLQLFKAAGISV